MNCISRQMATQIFDNTGHSPEFIFLLRIDDVASYMVRCPNGKGAVCKTDVREFDSHPDFQNMPDDLCVSTYRLQLYLMTGVA